MWVGPLSKHEAHQWCNRQPIRQATELNGASGGYEAMGGEDGGFDAHSASGSYRRAFSCKNHRDSEGRIVRMCVVVDHVRVALSVCVQLVGVPMADLILCVLCRWRCNVVGAEA